MSTQDTTLPPLPRAAVDEHNLQGGRLLYTRDQMQAYARAAIAAQAPQADACGDSCAAFEAAFMSENGFHTKAELAVEWDKGLSGVMFRAGIQLAQQAQGVPAGFERVTLPGGSYGWRYAVAESAQLLRAIDKNGGLSSGGESYPNALCVHDMAQRLGALLKLAAAPQAEPQTPEPSEERRQLLHLLDDIVEEADQDGATYYRIRDGKDILFSNMVGACARLLAQPEAPAVEAEPQPEREPLSPEQIEAGATSLAKLWKWGQLEPVYKDHYRARFVDACSAAGIGTKGGEKP